MSLKTKIIRTSLVATLAVGAILGLGGDAARAREGVPTLMPQVLLFGGPVVATPRVVPVFFPGDPLAGQLGDFLTKLPHDPAFASTLREYGVSPATVAPPITLTEAPPAQIASTDINAWLAAKTADPSFPQPDANTVYVIVYPDGTEVDFDFGGGTLFPECFLAGAYHDTLFTASGAAAAFVVAPRCDGFLGLSGADEVTVPLSADLAGAFTNPRVDLPGYAGANFEASAMSFFTNSGEIGELCEFLPNGFGTPPSLGYAISSIWSNRASRELHRGCRRDDDPTGYFAAMPLGIEGAEVFPFFRTKGIALPAGGEITIPVLLFRDEHGPHSWTISAMELPFDPYGLLTVSLDRTTGGDGDVRHLTVKRAPLPPGAQAVPMIVQIDSTANGQTNSWIVAVGD